MLPTPSPEPKQFKGPNQSSRPKQFRRQDEQLIPQGRSSPLEATQAQVILVFFILIAGATTLTHLRKPETLASSPTIPIQIDLNTATYEELNLLPGIGDKMVTKLISHRQRTGGFTNWRSVESIPGMGPATIAEMQRWCHLNDNSLHNDAIFLISRNH